MRDDPKQRRASPLPLPLFLASSGFLLACDPLPSEGVYPCTAENRCVRSAGQVACEPGYVFASPDDGADFRCVSAGDEEDCSPLKLTADGALDLSARLVQVSGAVTLNGAALPNTGRDRGGVRFTHLSNGAALDVALGSSGAFSYAVALPPGPYRVAYVPSASACTDDAAGPLPCGGGALGDAVTLSASGVLDLDIPTVSVTGNVSAGGSAPAADSSGRGFLTFSSGSYEAARVELPASGAMTYAVTLAPGSYSIRFEPSAACTGDVQRAMPCNGGLLEQAAPLTQSGSYDVDVPLVRVNGVVDLAGSAFPTSERGALTFSLLGGAPTTMPLPSSGDATWEATLIAGEYSVSHIPPAPSGCAEGDHTGSPCASQLLAGCPSVGGLQ